MDLHVTNPSTQAPAPVVKTDAEWREQLTPQEYHVLREAGTERPYVGEYTDTKTEGVYACRACGAELFRSDAKFESHCGWPSFFTPLAGDAVIERVDTTLGMRRVVRCELLAHAVQPLVEKRLGPRVQRREAPDDAGLALREREVGVRHDEQRRRDRRNRQPAVKDARQ